MRNDVRLSGGGRGGEAALLNDYLPLQLPLALLLSHPQLLVDLVLQLLLVELQLQGVEPAGEQDQQSGVDGQLAQKWRHLRMGTIWIWLWY